MTAPVDVESLQGARLYLSATLPDTYDQAGYESTDIVWTEVAEIENFGNHGGSKTITPFIPVATGIVAKVGGSKDYGTMALMLGNLASDQGQALLRTAFEASNTHYSVKIVYSDGAAVTPEKHYLDVLVAKLENQEGGANDVRKLSVDLALCRKPVVVVPT